MTRKDFSAINFSSAPDEALMFRLEQMIEQYPYCETLWLLLAAGWSVHEPFKFQQNLPKIATIASDRIRLKKVVSLALSGEALLPEEILSHRRSASARSETKDAFLETLMGQLDEIEAELSGHEDDNHPLKEQKQQTTIEEPEKAPLNVNEENEPTPKTEPEKPVRKRVVKKEEDLSDKMLISGYDVVKTYGENIPENIKKEDTQEQKFALIDRFLEKLPTISRTTGEFFNPEEMIERSVDEEELPVSETLAMILVQQGQIQKAIEIYRKLILENPEKSSYFAAQIENLSNI